MKLNRTFADPADLPATIPLFPLEGALLLPRRPIQLTVFEPRYLSMLDDSLCGDRLIGIIQPSSAEETSDPPPELYPLGCAGRIVQYAEIGDGRCFLTLMGVARFHLIGEVQTTRPYRIAEVDFAPFAEDFREGAGEAGVDREGLRDRVKEITGDRGVDIVYDPIGSTVFDESLRCLAWGGRILVLGFLGGGPSQPRTNYLLIKGLEVIGVRLGGVTEHQPEIGRANMKLLVELAGEGKLRPRISHSFPLDRAGDAIQAIIDRKVIGKAVLTG